VAARMLIVDDEEAIAFTLGEILSAEGHEVATATSAAQALALIEGRPFDLVLLDLRLGEESGLSLLSRLHRVAPATVVLILTGYGSMQSAIDAMRHGAFDYLLKPCNVDELKDAVARGLAHHRRRELAATIEAAQADLERVLRARDDFLAVAAHELRTPLAAVIGWAQHIQRELRRGGGEGAAEQLEVVIRQARRLARLVNNLIDIGNIQQGTLRLYLQGEDLGALVEQAVGEARGLYPDHTFRLTPLTAPPRVRANADALRQVLFNVFENATKFSPEGGEVEVRVQTTAGAARIIVRDHGVGIAPEDLPHVFDYYRSGVRNTASRPFGGLGVGLYLSRALVEAQGGHIAVENAGAMQGTVVSITLPLAGPDVPP
jgi:signal transduction histidine kinase